MKLAVDAAARTLANAELAGFLFPFGHFIKSFFCFLSLSSFASCNCTRSHLTQDAINHAVPSQHKFRPGQFVQCKRGEKNLNNEINNSRVRLRSIVRIPPNTDTNYLLSPFAIDFLLCNQHQMCGRCPLCQLLL